MKIRYISPLLVIFVLPVVWLVLGPLLMIGVAIGTHYGFLDCLAHQPISTWSECLAIHVTLESPGVAV